MSPSLLAPSSPQAPSPLRKGQQASCRKKGSGEVQIGRRHEAHASVHRATKEKDAAGARMPSHSVAGPGNRARRPVLRGPTLASATAARASAPLPAHTRSYTAVLQALGLQTAAAARHEVIGAPFSARARQTPCVAWMAAQRRVGRPVAAAGLQQTAGRSPISAPASAALTAQRRHTYMEPWFSEQHLHGGEGVARCASHPAVRGRWRASVASPTCWGPRPQQSCRPSLRSPQVQSICSWLGQSQEESSHCSCA
jgi:hypothetical protein